jgi:amino acid adenylation domain-containing protein
MDDEVQVEFDPFRGGEISRKAPSTEPQREILASALLGNTANIAFNEAVSLRISGVLAPDDIENALRTVVDRHDALRMTFTPAGNELCVTDSNSFALERIDLSDHEPAVQEEEVLKHWNAVATTPMDLIDGPLFRAIWLKLGDSSSELVMLAHHVVCDGWSYYVIIDELSKILSGSADDLSADVSSFADFAERQEASLASNQDIDYWLDHFEVVPPPLDLPLDNARPAVRTFAATRFDYQFDSELTETIRKAAGKLKASVVNMTLAGLAVLMHRLCRAEDLAIGLPVARQGTDNLPDLVGHGVQLLPIRLDVSGDDSFSDIVGRAKSAILDAGEHPNFTFGTLVRELKLSGDPSRVPLVPIIFNIDQPMGEINLGDATAKASSIPRVAENFEIFFNVVPTDGALIVEATFNTDLFAVESIENWLGALQSILADVAANSDKKISAIRLSDEIPQEYQALNSTDADHESGAWLESLQEHIDTRPDSIAAVDKYRSIDYREFDSSANRMAQALIAQGIGIGDIVGVYMDRTCDLPLAVTAVHRIGAAYVPLDPHFPESRLAHMLSDSGAKLVIADLDLPPALSEIGLPVLSLPFEAEFSDQLELPAIDGDSLAYIIYTSGSTGNPKGVEVHHDAVTNFLASMAATPGLTANDRLLAVTTLSFDISVLELLLPLCCGSSVYVANRQQAGDVRVLKSILDEQGITVMQATPATWRMLLTDGWRDDEMKVLCGGEALPVGLAGELADRAGELWNMYGPTETTIWSTCRRIEKGASRITIGGPIDNTSIYILDDTGHPLPVSIPGELCIGGLGVAKGYHNRPDLTAEKFIDHPQFGRIYRTGDMARILPGNDIEHLGRMDDQVKVRGFRIELGEIETVIQAHEDIGQAAVHVWEAKEGDSRIVACCVPAENHSIEPIRLRKHLRASLPEYMVPQHFLVIDSIPLTPNGKVDRRNLPTPVVTKSRLDRHSVEPPESPAEVMVASIWNKLIKPDRPAGRHDMFFEIGGHSLLALEALRQIEEKFELRLDPRILFQANLAEIAQQCGEAGDGSDRVADSRPVRLAAGTRLLLSEKQERMYRHCAEHPDTLRFHVTFAFEINGRLDVGLLESSLRTVFERHAILRSSFVQDDDGVFLQVNPAETACILQSHELSDVDDVGSAAMDLMVAQSKKPIDVANGPLVHMHLVRVTDDRHFFLFLPHHLVFDGWSFDIFLRELSRLYANGGTDSSGVLDSISLAYSDFSTWQRQRAAEDMKAATEDFWKSELQSLPAPMEWPGRESAANPIEREYFVVDVETMARLEQVCSKREVKLPDLLLAAFLIVLAQSTGRRDFLIGLATAGRFLPEVASLIGLFYNNLPVRFRMPEGDDLDQLLAYVGERVQASSEFQDVSSSRLAGFSGLTQGSENQLHQVTYSYQEARARDLELGDLVLEQVSVSRPGIENDIDFWVRNTRTGLVVSLDYRGDIADQETMASLCKDYRAALSGIGNNDMQSATWQSTDRLIASTKSRSILGRFRRRGGK